MAEVDTVEKEANVGVAQKVHHGEVNMPPDPEKSKAVKRIKAVMCCAGVAGIAAIGAAVALFGEDLLDSPADTASQRADGALEAKDYIPAGSVDVQEAATLIRVPCTPYASGGRIFTFSSGDNNKKPVVSIQNAPFDIDADGQKFTSGESTLLKIDLNNSTETIAFLARATSHCPKPILPSSNNQPSTTSVINTPTTP